MTATEPGPGGEDRATEPEPVAEDRGTGPGPHAGGRAQRRAAARAFRSHRTLPATLAALLLAAAAMVTMVGAVAMATRAQTHLPTVAWLAPLGRARWDDPAALTTAAVICVIGLAMLVAALTPGRARVIPLTSEDPQMVTGITRTGLRRHLTAVATAVDGVSRARVRLRRRGAQVTVATPLRDVGELPGEVGQAVEGRLEDLRPLRPIPVTVTVRRREE
ncbi:DUF6286 domain-containing protein [Sphaerisporangium perillae]|uniref:DUF6286 domain-containing protein n=1 Tax=Sphaerisporangium perillae TaxID=2935860 RepID=UPI00200E80B0|nr:DUF6286 domain-containing protein [Sphaerisporangium perillae]